MRVEKKRICVGKQFLCAGKQFLRMKKQTKREQTTTEPVHTEFFAVKKEVKAVVSGIYITDVKGLHGKIDTPVVKKKGFKAWVERMQEKAGAKSVK